MIQSLTEKVLREEPLTRDEALALYDEDLSRLAAAATTIRARFLGESFDLCTIVDGKNGRCTEDCAFCVQSRRSRASVPVFDLFDEEAILRNALTADGAGVLRYGFVTMGRRLSKTEVAKTAEIFRRLHKETRLHLCLSGGLLDKEDLTLLKDAGLERLHNNLETSRAFFPTLCTTHSYDEKIATIAAAKDVGLEVCSGALFGLGESRADRIDLAFTLKDLAVDSVPLNILHPIEGTPMEDRPLLPEDEFLKTAAIFRFLLPKVYLRLAGGRRNLRKNGEDALDCGVNAAITGDFLNTCGAAVAADKAMIQAKGFRLL